MHMGMQSNHRGVLVSVRCFFTAILVIAFVVLSGQSANALPAFARK